MAEPIEVPFSDDEVPVTVDDDGAPDKPGQTPAELSASAERRAERARKREAERKQAAEDLAAERKARQELEQRIARMEGAVQAVARPAQQQGDPWQAQLDQIEAERKHHLHAAQAEIASKTMTAERERHYEAIARNLDERRIQTHVSKSMAAAEGVQRQAAGQQVWAQRFPEVYGNPRAFNYAKATFERRLALGEQQSNEMVEEIMNETRAALKIGPKPTPTRTDRERLSGISSSSGGGSSEPTGGIRITPELRKMAVSLYSDLPEEQAIKKWVDTAGKSLRKDKVL